MIVPLLLGDDSATVYVGERIAGRRVVSRDDGVLTTQDGTTYVGDSNSIRYAFAGLGRYGANRIDIQLDIQGEE